MRISFHRQGIELTPEQRAHVQTRLQFALGRFGPRVSQVAVHLADINAGRGGVDKRCRLVARVQGLEQIVVEDHDEKFTPLVDRITERLGQTVSRRLERLRFGQDRVAFDGTTPGRPERDA